MWDIIPLCPNLRYLCFSSLERNASRIPASIGTTPNNVFRTLTRIAMEGVQAKSVPVLVGAINAAAAALVPQPLPLTHFHLSVGCSLLKRDAILELIDALRRTSLQVLHLARVHYARPDLLTAIARLTNLEDLTLIHKQMPSSDESFTNWPSPAYEYAAALRDFPKLSFFGFNSDLAPISYSPFYQIECEDDYAHVERNTDAAWKEWLEHNTRRDRRMLGAQDVAFHPENRDYFEDTGPGSNALPRLFAIHCPTLRLLHDRHSTWAFDRLANGNIDVRSHKDLTPAEERHARRMYDMLDLEIWDV